MYTIYNIHAIEHTTIELSYTIDDINTIDTIIEVSHTIVET
jgi:hypothetical protein